MANMEMPPVEELVARFKKLYTGIVADAMDKLGMRDRLLPQYLRPLKPDMVIAGPAFTGCGEEVTDINCNDNDIRFSMLESIKPYDIPVWQTNMTDGCAHWGGIMTRSTRQAGGCGAIIDGGCPGCQHILPYPAATATIFWNRAFPCSCASSTAAVRWAAGKSPAISSPFKLAM